MLAELDNSQLETAKRAALLTTALKYLLDRVPLTLVPLQARPAMRLFKAFTPYIGYIGGFVAWSWGAVKGFDKGYGVTLSATWLLTVAVIPGTCEKDDFPDFEETETSRTQSKEMADVTTGDKKAELSGVEPAQPPPLPKRKTLERQVGNELQA